MSGDEFDDAIDKAVRDIMGAEPPVGLRHRVLRGLSEPERRPLFTAPRLAVVAALALAVVIGTLVARRDQTTAPIRIASAPAPVGQIDRSPVRKEVRKNEPVAIATVHPRSADAIVGARRGRERDSRMVSATSVADADAVVIAPLDPLGEIETPPVASEVVHIDQITVAPLEMAAVRVDPLSSTPR